MLDKAQRTYLCTFFSLQTNDHIPRDKDIVSANMKADGLVPSLAWIDAVSSNLISNILADWARFFQRFSKQSMDVKKVRKCLKKQQSQTNS